MLDARFLFQMREKTNLSANVQGDPLTPTKKNYLKYARHMLVYLLLFLGCGSHAAAQKTIWPSTATPAVGDVGANGPVELGVSFKSDVSGYITGIRFYKSAANTGTHVGSLWDSAGNLLATATFTGETDSGWQEVDFPNPVPVNANALYVASYHAPSGHYSVDGYYFTSSGVDNAPLHAPLNGSGTPNGPYGYSSTSVFPTSTYNSATYWVDMVFNYQP